MIRMEKVHWSKKGLNTHDDLHKQGFNYKKFNMSQIMTFIDGRYKLISNGRLLTQSSDINKPKLVTNTCTNSFYQVCFSCKWQNYNRIKQGPRL